MPAGRRAGSAAAAASSAQARAVEGAPATPSPSPGNTATSSAGASSRWAVSALALPSTSVAASATALPPIWSERDAMVPSPRGSAAVSEWTTLTWSGSTPRVAATSRAKAVSWPWPWGDTPVLAVTRPSGSPTTSPYSDPPPVTSTYTDRPMPSWRTSPRSRRLACSARSSPYPAARMTRSSAPS
jgi:hypothetical protein